MTSAWTEAAPLVVTELGDKVGDEVGKFKPSSVYIILTTELLKGLQPKPTPVTPDEKVLMINDPPFAATINCVMSAFAAHTKVFDCPAFEGEFQHCGPGEQGMLNKTPPVEESPT